jgi:hypothetical protein
MTLGLISAYQYIYNGLASQYSNQLLISVHYRSVGTIIHNRSSNSVNFCTFGYGNRCRRIFPEFIFFNAFHIIVPSQRGGGAFRKVKTIQLLFLLKYPFTLDQNKVCWLRVYIQPNIHIMRCKIP